MCRNECHAQVVGAHHHQRLAVFLGVDISGSFEEFGVTGEVELVALDIMLVYRGSYQNVDVAVLQVGHSGF